MQIEKWFNTEGIKRFYFPGKVFRGGISDKNFESRSFSGVSRSRRKSPGYKYSGSSSPLPAFNSGCFSRSARQYSSRGLDRTGRSA